ncbi:hypothetical protein [Propionibacterium freudenreichii]|uniref:hypothetical protein n=1 Tax=Propionibacterium freudenreichii TaxID=1744 RepID=UPI0005443551|nr:hypothetical protein [Propionibacterium freudenreichii]AJQ89758.1 Hypothetical protein RM25_0023 [Propionibacterium freudenreichii subsp. freudenreichii]MDK9342517.1 hypothetical protein [Propionibacterium freudenreichii]CEG90800.1 Protein of unknown function [Propionibacterium freudenreichii]
MSSITDAFRKFMADKKAADAYTNPSLSASGLAEYREKQIAPTREWVISEVKVALAREEKAQQALNDQFAKDLAPSSDPQTVIARELTWQRLSARIAAGTANVDTIAPSASAHELETLATIGAHELPEDEAAYIPEAVVRAYPALPENQELYGALASQLATAQQEAGVARAAHKIALGGELDSQDLLGLADGDPDLFRELDDADALPVTNVQPFGQRQQLTSADVAV